MTNSELIKKEIEKIKSMTIELRNDLFEKGIDESFDRFNDILWELNVPLTNWVNSLKDKIDN